MYKNLSTKEINEIDNYVRQSTVEESFKILEKNPKINNTDWIFQLKYIDKYDEILEKFRYDNQIIEPDNYQKAACLFKAIINTEILEKAFEDQEIKRRNYVIAFKTALRMINQLDKLVNNDEIISKINEIVLTNDFDPLQLSDLFNQLHNQKTNIR